MKPQKLAIALVLVGAGLFLAHRSRVPSLRGSTLLTALTPRLRSGSLSAVEGSGQSKGGSTPPASALASNTMSFRVVFGEKQERGDDYSGSITLSQGEVVNLEPWRFFDGNVLEGDHAWKLQIKRIRFENQPDMPTPMNTTEPTLNYVPAGLVVTVKAPPMARMNFHTAQGDFGMRLEELEYGRLLQFRDGDVAVERVPTPVQVSPPPEGPNPEEHDYPSLLVTRNGVVWIAWQAYQNNGDNVYVRHTTSAGWSEPVRLTEQRGDVFKTALGEDRDGRVWAVWSERSGEDWDLFARAFDGRDWSPRRKLTSANHPNFFHRLVPGPEGALHLIWTGYEDGQSHVLWSKLEGNDWSKPVEVSGASAWMPDAATDSKGNLYVAWDSYRTGNYDIFFRKIDADGTMETIQQVTHSGKFQAHASVAVDRQDRVWLAWDESGDNWGKDWNRDDMERATTLYADRHPRVAVFENSVWKEPVGGMMGAVPRRYNRFVEEPRLACDSRGRVWAVLRLRTATANNRNDHWANNGRWESFLTSYEGDHWAPLTPIPETSSHPDSVFAIEPGPSGIWMAWNNNSRSFGPAAGFQPSGKAAGRNIGTHRPGVNEVDTASFTVDSAAAEARLEAFNDPPDGSPPVHPHEAEHVRRIRAYRTTADGATLQILRGDLHRHTEISGDGAGDGSVEDYFRYMLDAAEMDTGIIADHSAGGDNEYTWWRTEKAIDLYHIRSRYTPLFGYERSVRYPNGHRNVVFAERGVRTLPISREEDQGQVNSGPILYPYLKQHRGICMLHSLATEQGSDYRDNDPEVEPLVEIYQGYHANYEYEGAPRGESHNYQVLVHEKYEAPGFYWNALAKGLKLGVEASSDHVSTHSSYTMIYSPSTGRADIVESMRKRHAYGGTDNIIVDFEAVDNQGRAHMMGDAFESARAPRLSVKIIGTDTLSRVEVIKDGRFVYTSEPKSDRAEFTYVDNEPGQGTSWYYVRAMQMDRNLAWSSPIWVKYPSR